MKLKIKTARLPESIKEVCQAGIDHNLYVSGWSMYYMFQNPETITVAVLAFHDGVPIGVCLAGAEIDYHYDVSVFIKPEYRRLGIGSKLVEKAKKYYEIKKPEMARQESRGFFGSLGYAKDTVLY